MADELPDGTRGGYEGYCPKCGTVIQTNIQGNEISEHNCIMKHNQLIALLKTKSSPLVLEWTNSRGIKCRREFHFNLDRMYGNEFEDMLIRINCKPCQTKIL